jgi:hypothetical protein
MSAFGQQIVSPALKLTTLAPLSPPPSIEQPASVAASASSRTVRVVFVGTHWPAALHVLPLAHVPQLPPQPSLPQVLPLQLGVQLEAH